MNADAFDRFTMRLGASTSRRGLLKAFAAGVAAAIVGPFGSKATPAAVADGPSPYPATFLKGIGYAEGWPALYNPSTANGLASGVCASDGSGHFEFFGSDEARSESAPMWSPTFTLRSGTSGSGRDDVGSIAGMGATMIRIYDWDARNDHLPFLDYCQQKGISVLVSVVNYYLQNPGAPYFGAYPPTPALMQALVKSFGNAAGTDYHPAVAGIIIGNEPRLNGYGAAQAITVTRSYLAAEQAVGFASRPMIGHPVDFATYGGQYPCWGFWDPLIAGLSDLKSRLFLSPQTYNTASYLFTNTGSSGQGYVPLTWNRYQLPILFTEIGQDRTKPNYQTVITDQLTGSIRYATQHPEQLLGVAFFQFADKGWLCPAGGTCPSEGSFGAFSHSRTTKVRVPYVQADFTHLDFYNQEGQLIACADQSVSFDVLTATTSYGLVKAAYSGGTSCGGADQPCCGGANGTCNSGFNCSSGTCVACGTQNQPCCTTGNPCTAGLLCSSGTCVPQNNCGALNQPCCDTNPPCGVTLTCLNGTCQSTTTCGDEGQPCCTGGGTPCSLGLTCVNNVCTAQTGCGKSGKICCKSGDPCDAGLACVNNTCRPTGACGQPGQPCCAGPTGCNLSNTVCLGGTCQYCGLPNQPCCAGNSCAQSNIICCSTGKCNTVDNMCHACGLPGQPCCGGIKGTCTSPSTCQSGTCR